MVLLALFVVARFVPRGTGGLLRVTFLDVGQGDATVIESPTGRIVVIDGGGHPGTTEGDGRDPGSRVVVPYLRSRGVNRVDLLVPTHPDDDHVQGLVAVAERFPIAAALECGLPDGDGVYGRLQKSLRNRHIPLYNASRGQCIDLGGGARLEVLNPPNGYPAPQGRSVTNNASVVLRLVYGKARVLLTGDAEAETEEDMLASGADLSADVLKVGHHGSRWSSIPPFVAHVHPQAAIISCGRNNTFGHPHKEVLERFAEVGTQIYRTDQQGAIILETNGQRIRLTTMR